jgi:hypothetical protein
MSGILCGTSSIVKLDSGIVTLSYNRIYEPTLDYGDESVSSELSLPCMNEMQGVHVSCMNEGGYVHVPAWR